MATPGRLEDMFRRKAEGLDLAGCVRSLDVLVLDEADRLLDMGFEARYRALDWVGSGRYWTCRGSRGAPVGARLAVWSGRGGFQTTGWFAPSEASPRRECHCFPLRHLFRPVLSRLACVFRERLCWGPAPPSPSPPVCRAQVRVPSARQFCVSVPRACRDGPSCECTVHACTGDLWGGATRGGERHPTRRPVRPRRRPHLSRPGGPAGVGVRRVLLMPMSRAHGRPGCLFISINTILEFLPKQRRTGLFSATQTQEVESLVRAGLRNPVRVSVKEKGAAASSSQKTPSRLQNHYMVSAGAGPQCSHRRGPVSGVAPTGPSLRVCSAQGSGRRIAAQCAECVCSRLPGAAEGQARVPR